MLTAALVGLALAMTEFFFIRASGLTVMSLVVLPLVAAFTALFFQHRRATARLRQAERQRDEMAVQLERRISELFTLRELGYVLSDSFQVDRIVEQVARYVRRFVAAEGVMVVLTEEGRWLRVAAAEGSLEGQAGRRAPLTDVSLVTAALERGRIEVDHRPDGSPVRVLYDLLAQSAAVVPLRSRDETLGALAVVDHAGGPFTTEDLWLLSTVATSASVVLANSRLFARVEHGRVQWETAFDSLREGIAVLNADGTIQRANRALATLAGSEAGALAGRSFSELLFEDPAPAREYMRRVQAGTAAAPPNPGTGRAGGQLRLTLAPLGGAFGRGAVVALVEDVTEQRIMEAQLIQSEKLAAIGQLVSGVAHELNNPLTSIAGLAELLLESEPLPESPRQHLRIIHDQADRAGRIVRNLLMFARKDSARKTLVDLNEIVGRTTALVGYDMRLRDITFDASLAGGAVLVHGDPHELQQVLLNLLTNAIHALAGLPPEAERRIMVETGGGDGTARLAVHDTGPGVPGALRARLFTPFFTTKPAGQGTGLGLSLSYGIAQSHGGALSYAERAGGGASFVLQLPLKDVVPETAPDEPRHILVADSDPGIHRLVSALFAPDGHVVHAAPEAARALELLKGREYDMVVADGAMLADRAQPVIQVLREARPEWEERFVVLGAAARGADPARCLSKPLDVRRLRQVASQILGGRPRSVAGVAGGPPRRD